MSPLHPAQVHPAQAQRQTPSSRGQGQAPQPASWADVRRWEDLERIAQPALNALVLRRGDLVQEAIGLAPTVSCAGASERLQDRGRPEEALAAALCDHLPHGPLRDVLELDAAQCIRAFRALVDAPFIASLAAVAQVQCPKFHADRVTLRLLCTYVGPGTEWLEEAHVRREALGQANPDMEDANRQIQCCPVGLHRTATGDVLLLKGERWRGNVGRGAVHRSPALSAGETRLVLTLSAGMGG